MAINFLISTMLLVFSLNQASADGWTPVNLEPIDHHAASLTIVRLDGTENVYSPKDLEKLPTYRLVTRTPWRDTPAAFDGVLLRDFLAANGLDRAPAIRIIAENDFSTIFDRALIDSVDILIATRVNDKAHSRRARGPIQFVLEESAFKGSEITDEANYVWMAARIEAYF